MKNRIAVLLMFVFALSLVTSASATRFEKLFKITKVTGSCTVNGSNAEEGKAYAYGSTVKTGRKSTAIISFAPNNECRVLANAPLVVKEDVKDSKLKIIKLKQGKVRVVLEEKFHEEGNGLNVETATAICGAIGCDFSVEFRSEEGLNITVVYIEEGEVRVYCDDFDSVMGSKDTVSITSPPEGDFTRVRIIKGEYDITIKDSEGATKTITVKEDTIIKIFRKSSTDGEYIVVTVLVNNPDGSVETYTYNVKDTNDGTRNPITPTDPKPKTGGGVRGGDEFDPTVEEEDETTEETTTTTTIPSTTPTGLI